MQDKVVGMDNFLRCTVLLLLNSSPSHGYELSGNLYKMKLFGRSSKKRVSIYSCLRKMENERLIMSEWSIEKKQKPKRVYSITETGKVRLGELISTISEHATALFELVEIYRHQVLS